MDVNNSYLKQLIDQTDEAFKQLIKDPASDELNCAYEDAKHQLERYLVSIRERSDIEQQR
ncbi:hypothetical protein [Alteromonas facilis]|uniref:hypothetical protein n=1 Tax=Alteromonas facilis TaxID=2048004 RepID=UPI000C294C5B|nr:hypothetical protein [Alteromonas facilis]